MRVFPRADRVLVRIGNVLPDVSGEIVTQPTFAMGTGPHETVGAMGAGTAEIMQSAVQQQPHR